MQRADLLAYSHGKYYGLGDFVGKSAGRSERKNSHEENLPYIADTSILFLGQRPEVYQDRRQDIQLGRKSWSQWPRSRLSNR